MSLEIEGLAWGHPQPGGGWRQLFNAFSLHCPSGQFVVLIGSNGSGKSTLLNLIAGSLPATAGSLRLEGRELLRLLAHRRARSIGRVMQNPLDGTAPGLTIAENLRLAECRRRSLLQPRALLGLHPGRGDRRRYAALLEELGLPLADRLETPVGQLSGGQRQTISLVMASLGEPRLLLLDEHTAALDPRAEASVMQLTERLVQRLGSTTLMVTHSLEQALRYGDRLVMLQDGAVIGDWTAEQRQQFTPAALQALYGSATVPLERT
ncbi:MAG: ATP-binding cassette domain-containing protein [Cyanobacteria bacterium M_surface_10_m2_179]|nr:ATP-binding cassette domain-containing protein [Cyanobacteria bacterium M_surface_10_m2_179]